MLGVGKVVVTPPTLEGVWGGEVVVTPPTLEDVRGGGGGDLP